MSNLETVVQSQLATRKEFTFLGDDGYVVQANNYGGVLAVLVTDPEGNPTFDHFTDFRNLLNHLKAHGGHLHH